MADFVLFLKFNLHKTLFFLSLVTITKMLIGHQRLASFNVKHDAQRAPSGSSVLISFPFGVQGLSVIMQSLILRLTF